MTAKKQQKPKDDSKRLNASYNKKSYLPVLLRIPKKEKDLVTKLESVPSKNGYILSLIKDDVRPSILRLSTIKSVLKEVLGKHQIRKIYLFGSYARGEATSESDVDILCDKGDISTLIEQGKLEEELEERLGKKVDLIFTTSYMDGYFKEQIEKDLIELC